MQVLYSGKYMTGYTILEIATEMHTFFRRETLTVWWHIYCMSLHTASNDILLTCIYLVYELVLDEGHFSPLRELHHTNKTASRLTWCLYMPGCKHNHHVTGIAAHFAQRHPTLVVNWKSKTESCFYRLFQVCFHLEKSVNIDNNVDNNGVILCDLNR